MLEFLVVVAVLIAVIWMVNAYLPVPPPLKMVINIIAVVIILYMLLRFAGVGLRA